MSNLEYKGYVGITEFDAGARAFVGEVVGTRDVITFEGTSVDELEKAFRASVEDYLAFCVELGKEPEKSFSGQFVARVGPEGHRLMTRAAVAAGMSLNAWAKAKLLAAAKVEVPGDVEEFV